MYPSAPQSLKREYELYIEHEIEEYKDSIPRAELLCIGDEAVAALARGQQIELTELVLWEEVDRIIKERLRLPSYRSWRRRRLRELERLRRPEHWGLEPDDALVRTIQPAAESHVLVAGPKASGAALYLAANGCEVTALEQQPDAVERVMTAAEEAGLTQRVRGCVTDLRHWAPDVALHAVICTPAAFEGLSPSERGRAIEVLQSATIDGGVHLVETIVAGQTVMTLEELETRYLGWDVRVEKELEASRTFVARKGID
jgi:hypothetical protein